MIVISPLMMFDVERLSPRGKGNGNVADLDPAWHLGMMTNAGLDAARSMKPRTGGRQAKRSSNRKPSGGEHSFDGRCVGIRRDKH
jgi:hypothetical protein